MIGGFAPHVSRSGRLDLRLKADLPGDPLTDVDAPGADA